MQSATAPNCVVVGCDELSALTDVTNGAFFNYHAHYCAACYKRLADGESLQIAPGTLELHPARPTAINRRPSNISA